MKFKVTATTTKSHSTTEVMDLLAGDLTSAVVQAKRAYPKASEIRVTYADPKDDPTYRELNANPCACGRR